MFVNRLLGKIRYSSSIILTIIVVLILLLLYLLLGFFIHFKINENYKKDISLQSIKVLHKIDTVFDQAHEAALATSTTWGYPCDQVEYNLRKIVATINIARSATTVFKGAIYCSSIFNIKNRDLDTNQFRGRVITMLNGNRLTPNTPMLFYNLSKNNWEAVIGINGQFFAEALQIFDSKEPIFLVINNSWMNISGAVFPAKKESNTPLLFKSEKYPFQILINMTGANYWSYLYLRYIIIFAVLTALGLFATVFIYRTAAEREFGKAINAGQIVPYYQLLVTSNSLEWHGFEVLSRWQHPYKGIISPNFFIPLAERSNQIIPMTKMLMNRVAYELAPFAYTFPKSFAISFNITASHLSAPDLIIDCQNFLNIFPKDRVQLILELTESVFIDNAHEMNKTLQALQQLGVKVSIDDFGTGYSNLAYLGKFKIDNLKIDKAFVSMIYGVEHNHHLLDTIIDLAKNMGVDLVAEGVETIEQLQYLASRGVHYIQGFLFSRPTTITEMLKELEQPCQVAILHQQYSMFSDT